MPCDSSHCAPTDREIESQRVLELLRETRRQAFDHEHPITGTYGDVANLDHDTALLCSWCRQHDVSRMSLELQLWWQRHQRHDAEREAKERHEAEELALAKQAYDKLTPAERHALRLTRGSLEDD